MDVTIRPATPDDYEAICEVLDGVDALHRDALPHIFRKPDGPVREREDILEQVAGGDDMGLFVAEASGQVVGVLQVLICESPPERLLVPRYYASIDDLVVRKSWRRRGVGRALMARAEEWAREKGLGVIELGVWEFNADARCFYEQLGYTTLSRTMSKPLGDPSCS
jgi:GNAT superfamily N-acetyltransferase